MVPSDSPPNPPPSSTKVAPSFPQHPIRRFLRFGLRLVLILVGVVLLAVVFRLELLNRAGPWLLTRELGLPVELEATRFNWREAHIDRLTLGTQNNIVVEGITLSHDPLNAKLQSVEIGRVVILAGYDPVKQSVDIGELNPLIDRLRTMASTSGDPNDRHVSLPDILIKSIELKLASPAGVITGNGQANVSALGVIAQFTLHEPRDYARVDLNVAAPLTKNGNPPLGDIALAIDGKSALWSLLGLSQPKSGTLKASAHLRTPESEGAINTPLALADWQAEAIDLTYPGLPHAVNATLGGLAALGANSISLEKLSGNLKGGLNTTFAAQVNGQLHILPFGETQEITGNLDLKLQDSNFRFAGGNITNAVVSAPVLLSAKLGPNTNAVNLALQKTGKLAFQRLALSDGSLILPSATSLLFKGDSSSSTDFTWRDNQPLITDLNLTLAKSSFNIDSKMLGERLVAAIPEAVLSGRYTSPLPFIYSIDIKNAQLGIPKRALVLDKVAFNLARDTKALKAKMSTGAFVGLGAFTPVKAAAEATLTGNQATFKARFRGEHQPIDLSITGKADIALRQGSANFHLEPIDFVIGGLQPHNLFPNLRDDFNDISGRVALEGPVYFDKNGHSADLKLGVTKFSGKIGPMRLTNANTVISIDKVWPLSTKPNQIVAIELVDIGLPLTNALFRFKISDGRILDLQESRLETTGGKVVLDPAILTHDKPAQNLLLRVDNISVAQLFDAFGIAGLSGEGNISGTVPVTIFPGGIAIPDAKLTATEPGVLRYDKTQAPLALQSAGESVALALEALANFHYEKLIIDLNRNLTGNVILGLHITGRNPNFYDGYPVEFNLSIEGRLDQALKEGLAGYRVPDMIKQQLEKLSP